MTAARRFSSCVGCGTPIIGERLRCPACHDEHAAQIATPAMDDTTDDAQTVPRPKQRVRVANRAHPRDLVRWVIELLVVSGLALVFVLWEKGCS